MKTTKLLIIPLMVLALLPALSNAQNDKLLNVGVDARVDVENNSNRNDDNRNRGNDNNNDDKRGGWMFWNKNKATTTKPVVNDNSNYLGEVTAVYSTSFLMTSPKNSTSTVLINVNADTRIKSSTSTLTLANLAVGQKVAVNGTYSTTSNSVLATNVALVSTSTTDVKYPNGNANGFWSNWKNWFKRLF